jgi:hypothetical protein
MRKLFLTLILLYSTFLYAEIDERKSDVYFANGVDTDIGEANKAKNELDKQTKKLYPEAYKQIKDWKVSYNETHGFQQDIYESAIQKLFTKLDDTHSGYGYAGATAWVVDTVMQTPGLKDFVKGALYFGGRKLVKDTLKELLIEETKNTLAKRGLILSKEDILFLADLIFDELLDNLLANPLDDTLDDINKDVLTQATAYANSIEQGHGVIVVAHSQGNFFTNFTVEEKMQPWTQKYFHVLGVATPTSSIANGGAYLTFDNDVIQAVPGHLGWNVKNPKRYQFSNTNIETFFSVEAHNFLESYMATPATSNAILGFIEGAITTHNTADSQWKKSKKFGCGCKERIYVEHKYDTSLNQLMNEVDVVAFEEILKLYPIKGEYYKGSYNGDDIKKYETGEVCIDLLNNNGFAIDEFLGKVKESNPNSGVVEISLKWDNEEVDLDLQVGWSAGSVVVKDTCKPFEHFHIRSEATIYPGTYGVSIIPKNTNIIKITQTLTSLQAPINYNLKHQTTRTHS